MHHPYLLWMLAAQRMEQELRDAEAARRTRRAEQGLEGSRTGWWPGSALLLRVQEWLATRRGGEASPALASRWL